MNDERMRLLTFSQIEGLGNKGKRTVLEYFGDTEKIFSCPESEIRRLWFLNDRGTVQNLENDEAMVYSCLDFYPKSFESLSKETGLSMLNLMSSMMKLCDKGLALEVFKNEYVKI